MQPADYSAPIRASREDLTEYVIHLTRSRTNPLVPALEVLKEILNSGYIKSTFCGDRRSPPGKPTRPWVKGPYPAVCLTEQPLSALIKTLAAAGDRYAGYGIAYYKPILYDMGGRPVLYGSEREIGQKVKEGEPGWESGKEIYRGGLPPELQYLWVKYDPLGIGPFNQTVDFTWEREWRVRFPNARFKDGGLPVAIDNPWSGHKGAIIVAREAEIPEVHDVVERQRSLGAPWTRHAGKTVSLEKASEKLRKNDLRYARLETWPDGE